MYDHTRSVRRGDNPNKKTLMNIPDFAYGHSPVVPAEKSICGEGNSNNILDVPVPDRAPTRSMIQYLQRENKPNSRACGGFPVNGAISRVGKIPQQNMYVFIRPYVQMREARRLAGSEWKKSYQRNRRGLWEEKIPTAEWGTLSGKNSITEGFDSRRTIEKGP